MEKCNCLYIGIGCVIYSKTIYLPNTLYSPHNEAQFMKEWNVIINITILIFCITYIHKVIVL